jgi:hypothetical protein
MAFGFLASTMNVILRAPRSAACALLHQSTRRIAIGQSIEESVFALRRRRLPTQAAGCGARQRSLASREKTMRIPLAVQSISP